MADLLALQSAEELRNRSAAELELCRSQLAEIIAVRGERDVDNTLRPFNQLSGRLATVASTVGLLRSVHPAAELRRAAEECEQELGRFATQLGLHRELYEAVRACDVSGLDPVSRRLHERLLRDFRRQGVDRDDATRAEIESLRNRLVELNQEFARNILSDVRSIEVKFPEELEGLPEDYLRSHPPDAQGRVKISTDYPDYNPYMSYSRCQPRRRDLYTAFRNRAYPQNQPVLVAMLESRHRLATLLGYAGWADYAAEDKMIQSGSAIASFIDRVAGSAADASGEEYAQLLERKRRDEPSATAVDDWEKAYYEELLRKEHHRIDSRELRPYFEFTRVKNGVLDVLARLFGLEFRSRPDAPRWHPDVEVLDVLEGGASAGRIYLDMHPREGKFKHAAMFPIVPGIRGGPLPEAALVCNFPRPGADGPALLEHDDVVTLFHELGHLLHHLFAREQEWVEFSGTATEWDFVEVPSQLLEEWAWDGAVLKSFARHQTTGEEIPDDLVARLRRSKGLGRGLWVRQQMYYASLSLACHVGDPRAIDLDRLEAEMQGRFSRFAFVPGTHFHASFGHLSSYSALYYTYMWSLVIEKDILSQFRAKGLMDRETAARCRAVVLAPGGSRDAADLVNDFLGRPFRFDAFADWLKE